ncbi:MAG: hypothetical protein AB7P40_00005 [Chloroflexota bacterium]
MSYSQALEQQADMARMAQDDHYYSALPDFDGPAGAVDARPHFVATTLDSTSAILEAKRR